VTRAPQVSVLMPVGGEAAWMEQAVGSILAQSLTDLELVLAVNARLPRLLERVAALPRDDRLRVLSLDEPDMVVRVNQGLSQVRGALVARMDADDLAHPQRLALQAGYLARHPEVAAVGAFVTSNVDSETIRWTNSFHDEAAIRRNLFIDSPVVHPTLLARAEAFRRHGGYRVNDLAEDYDLVLRWVLAGERLEKLPEPLLFWRRHDAALTRCNPRYSNASQARLKVSHLARDPRLSGRPLGILNGGAHGRDLCRALLEAGVEPRCFFDVDQAKHGRRIRNRYPILPHTDIPQHPDLFLLCARGGMDERATIRAYLEAYGRQEEQDYLFLR
jgi:glycosyltransferase involved in cell wall biosynthesis